MKSTMDSRPRIRRLMTFAVGGAMLASSVSVGAVATQPPPEEPMGMLTINKEVANPDGADLSEVTFRIDYKCTGGGRGGKEGYVELKAGESETIGGIEGSKQCAVTEVAPDKVPFFTWGTTFYTQMPVFIDKENPTGSITVENRITRSLGELEIAKTLDDDSEEYSGEFSINYSCEPVEEDAPGTTVSGVVTVAAGDSEVAKIPTGYECVVTETTFPSVPGFAWSTPVVEGGSPTSVINQEEPTMVSVENLLSAVPPPPPPTPPAPAPAPAPAAAAAAPPAATPPAAGTVPETIPVVPLTPVVPAPGTGVTPTTPVTTVEPAPGTGVPTSVNAGEGPAPSNGISVAMWLLMIAAISAAVTWGLTRWTNADGETHMQKVHVE